MYYRKKPVVIEAFQYDGNLMSSDGTYCVPGWAVDAYDMGVMYHKSDGGLYIATLEGEHHVSVLDYVIKGVQGELYPCKPDIFAETYEFADIESN